MSENLLKTGFDVDHHILLSKYTVSPKKGSHRTFANNFLKS